MRRQDNALFSDHGQNVPSVYSSTPKAQKMASALANTAVDTDDFLDFAAYDDFLSEDLTLQPKLDAVLADVATKLPSIDFDMSDVSCLDYFFYKSIINYFSRKRSL